MPHVPSSGVGYMAGCSSAADPVNHGILGYWQAAVNLGSSTLRIPSSLLSPWWTKGSWEPGSPGNPTLQQPTRRAMEEPRSLGAQFRSQSSQSLNSVSVNQVSYWRAGNQESRWTGRQPSKFSSQLKQNWAFFGEMFQFPWISIRRQKKMFCFWPVLLELSTGCARTFDLRTSIIISPVLSSVPFLSYAT